MKSKSLIILAIVVALLVGVSYLFSQISGAQQAKTERALPSTAATRTGAPSIIATSPTPPQEPEKPPPPEHQLPSPVVSKPIPEKEPVHHESSVPLHQGPAKATGDDCTDPIIVTLPAQLPYSDLNDSTCGRGNDYSTTCLGSYDGGEDIIYRLDVTSTVKVDIVLNPKGTTYTGIALDDECPLNATTCLATHTNYGSGIHGIYGYTLAPGTYWIMIDTYPAPDCIPNFDLTITATPPPPPNDDCASAEAIGDVTNQAFSTTLATHDQGTTCTDGPNIWYVYTATCSGNAYVGLCGSSYDTKLGVYDGYSCSPLPATIGCDDDGCAKSVQSELYFVAVQGNQYLIEVGGYSTYTGSGVLTISCQAVSEGACCNNLPPYDCQLLNEADCNALGNHTWLGGGTTCTPCNPCPRPPPDNDLCENAIVLNPPVCPDVQTVNGTTIGATLDCPGVLDRKIVWYKFDLTYTCNNVYVDYCPTNNPLADWRMIVLYGSCDCPDYIFYTSYAWVTCPGGATDLQINWKNLPAGDYWLPVLADDADTCQMDFAFSICVEECPPPEPGDNCTLPIVINLNKKAPGDTLYLDQNQTTCGRGDDYYGTTCLGYYDGGEDIIYQVNVSTAIDVDIKLDDKGNTYGGVAIDAVCPPGATCMAYASGYSGPYTIFGVHLDPGTYYIMVDTWPAPDCIPDFDLFIIESEGATAGNNCGDPVLVTLPADMPYSDVNHTCARVDDYYGTTCLGYYDGGEDIIYEVTVTDAVAVQVILNPMGTTWTGIALDSSCPPGATCMYKSTNSGSTPHGFIANLSPGTYYIMIDTYPSPDCIPEFELTIGEAPEAPENDTCGGAPVISIFPTTVYGTTVGATIDCPGVLDWDAVWYRFDVPYATNNVFVDFCPTDGYIATVGVVLYDECPPDCPNYILRTGYAWVSCPSGYSNPTIWWDELPGPASYWFPVYVEPGKKGAMDFGFEVSVEEAVPCTVACPEGGIPEGEPECYDGYVDEYNAGCNSTPWIWQDINCGDTICGTSGVYDANYNRDTDWFRVEVGDGDLTWTCVAEFPLLIFILEWDEDCLDVPQLGYALADKCDTASLSFSVSAGVYWLWVGPQDWGNYPCGDQSEYVAWVDCTPFGPQIAVDPDSFNPVLNPTGACSSKTENLFISSVGGEDLTYNVTENPPVAWLQVLPHTSNTLPPGTTDTLTVSFDAGGMTPGDYYTTLDITSNAPKGVVTVPVHLKVELAPEIGLPVRLWVPVIPGCSMDKALRVDNLGTGELRFEVSVQKNPPPLMAAGKKKAWEPLWTAPQSAPKHRPADTPVAKDGTLPDRTPQSRPESSLGSGKGMTTPKGDVILSEGFEGVEFPPAGWQVIQTNVTTWVQSSYSSHTGTYSAECWWNYGHQDEWLITPDLEIAGPCTLTFWTYVYRGSTYGDQYWVKISTDGGMTWDALMNFTDSTGDWNYFDYPYHVGLDAYAGQTVNIAWHADDPPDEDGMWWAWLIDDVTVECFGPPCPFTVSPEEGDIPAESFFDVFLTFDGTVFEDCVEETLACYLVFTSNDCDESQVVVPVFMWSARGDVNGDCKLNVLDVVFLINYCFIAGPAPDPLCIGDVDRDGDDCDTDSDDILYLISYLFLGGPPPLIPLAPTK